MEDLTTVQEKLESLRDNTVKLLGSYEKRLTATVLHNKVSYEQYRNLNKERFSGNGFIRFGYDGSTYQNETEDSMWVLPFTTNHRNMVGMGSAEWTSTGGAREDKDFPLVHVDGHILYLRGSCITDYTSGRYDDFGFKYPPIEDKDFVKQVNDITSVYTDVKEGEFLIFPDSSKYIAVKDIAKGTDLSSDRSKLEEVSSLTRKDFGFLEVWVEEIDEKDIVFPYGNVQYRHKDVDGVTGLTDDYIGSDWYSLFGAWMTPGSHKGLGYKWSSLSKEDKLTLASNPKHNIYKDNKKYYQVRYRARTVKGVSVKWNMTEDGSDGNFIPIGSELRVSVQGKEITPYGGEDFTTVLNGSLNTTTYYNGGVTDPSGIVTAIPFSVVQRTNDGVFHPLLNPEGTAYIYDSGSIHRWWVKDYLLKSPFDCFDTDLIGYITLDSKYVNRTNRGSLDKHTGTVVKDYYYSTNNNNRHLDSIIPNQIINLTMDCKTYSAKEILDEGINLLQKDMLGGYGNKLNTGKIKGIYRVSRTTVNGAHNTRYMFVEDFDGNEFSGRDDLGLTSLGGYWINLTKNESGFIGWVDNAIYLCDYETLFDQNYSSKHTEPGDIIILIEKGIDKDVIESSFITNNVVLGEIEKLKFRPRYETKPGSVYVEDGDYIKCVTNEYNNGVVGHYYKLVNTSGMSLNLDVDSGIANVNNGRADFANNNIWLDMGTDGEIGGIPDKWKNFTLGSVYRSPKYKDRVVGSGNGALRINLPSMAKGISTYPRALEVVAYHTLTGEFKLLDYLLDYDGLANTCTKKGYYIESNLSTIVVNPDGIPDNKELHNYVYIVTYRSNINPFRFTEQSEVELLSKNSFMLYFSRLNPLLGFSENFIGKGDNYSTNVKRVDSKSIVSVSTDGSGKLPTYTGTNPYIPINDKHIVASDTALKLYPYLTKTVSNSIGYLNILAKGLVSSDDSKFEVVDNSDSVVDGDGHNVRVGNLRTRLNKFIKNKG